jgi:hypothetical protein
MPLQLSQGDQADSGLVRLVAPANSSVPANSMYLLVNTKIADI